jgi:hypothetical protein
LLAILPTYLLFESALDFFAVCWQQRIVEMAKAAGTLPGSRPMTFTPAANQGDVGPYTGVTSTVVSFEAEKSDSPYTGGGRGGIGGFAASGTFVGNTCMTASSFGSTASQRVTSIGSEVIDGNRGGTWTVDSRLRCSHTRPSGLIKAL